MKEKEEKQMEDEIKNNAEGLLIAVNEFLNDWRKGDFELGTYAQLDAESMEHKAIALAKSLGWKTPK